MFIWLLFLSPCLWLLLLFIPGNIIHNPVVPFYDIDGWWHLIHKMMETGESWSLLENAASLWRGFFVPFIFGLSYCIFQIPESVQIANVLFQASSSFFLTYWFASAYKNPLLGMAIGFTWAVWPAFSKYYGYYFSEPVCGFVFVLLN